MGNSVENVENTRSRKQGAKTQFKQVPEANKEKLNKR
jgi:hypothetical protein